MKKILTIFVLFIVQTILFSQNPSENFLGSWYTYGSNHRLSEKYSLTPYGEIRFYEPSANYNLLFISLRGNYFFNSNTSIGLGYAYLDIDTVFEFDNQPNVHEHRLFEQVVYKHTFSQLKVAHRGRFEHRFLNFRTRNDIQNRFRYLISLKYNINKTFYTVISEEPFINFQDQVFHENRFYIGLGANITPHTQFNVGYLKQHIRKNNLNRIRIGISIQTDSRKPKATVSQL